MKKHKLIFAALTPLLCEAQSFQDTDGDLLPDSWEISHGSDPDVNNSDADFDRDHLTLLEEYQFGGGNTLNPFGQWRVTPLPFPPGVTDAHGNDFAIPAFNNEGAFLIRDWVSLGPGLGSTLRSWLYIPESNHYESIFPENDVSVFADGLNDQGEIVGLRWFNSQGWGKGFHFSPWAGLRDYDLRSELGLSTNDPSYWTYPRQINNDGEMIGLQAGYGSFYHDWLGRVKGFEVDLDLDPGTSNPVFSHLNQNGTAIGTYTGLDGSFNLFTYQPELSGAGQFHYTDLEAEYPPNLRAILEGGNSGSVAFTWEEDGSLSNPFWEQTAWLNDHGEFVGKYSADPTVEGIYQGIYYFDGDWLWEIAGSTATNEEHAIAGLNNWPAFVMQIGTMPKMFHGHVALPLNQFAVGPSAGANPADWSEAVVRGVNDLGQILVTATDATTGNQGIYLLSLDQDSDGDGMPDDWEDFFGVSEPHLDSDGDGLSNYREFTLNLDPTDPLSNLSQVNGSSAGPSLTDIDDDGDGIPNTVEVLWGLDPNSSSDASLDLDGDGLTNHQEFLAGTSALSVDSDRDGLTDLEEVESDDSDPTNADQAITLAVSSTPVVISPLH